LPPAASRSLLFKPFIPKHLTNCSGKENISLTQDKNRKENKNIMPETSFYSGRFDVQNSKFVGPQIFQKHQEMKCLNTSTSFVEKFNMNSLENSLPKFPLRTIWTNDSSLKDFGYTLPLQNNVFKKPFSSGLNCMSHTMQNTNCLLKSKFQNKTQDPLNSINVSQYFRSSFSHSNLVDKKLHPVVTNTNTSFFTSGSDKSSSAINKSVNTLESNSFSCINQPFNMDDIWKNDQYQPPRM